jgi:arsenate reductase
MQKVLILCTGNSCRSQMAEGFLKYFSPNTQVSSAGTKPEDLNAFAVEAMANIGIDIANFKSNHADEYADIDFDFVFTLCDNANEICPIYPNAKKLIHNSFSDPANAIGTKDEQLLIYSQVRDQIKDYMQNFAENNLKK